jgi:hypothetical protein
LRFHRIQHDTVQFPQLLGFLAQFITRTLIVVPGYDQGDETAANNTQDRFHNVLSPYMARRFRPSRLVCTTHESPRASDVSEQQPTLQLNSQIFSLSYQLRRIIARANFVEGMAGTLDPETSIIEADTARGIGARLAENFPCQWVNEPLE